MKKPDYRTLIQQASSEEIEEYEDIAREFLFVICKISYDVCLITDESCLSDFAGCCVPQSYEPDYPLSASREEKFKHLYSAGRVEIIAKVKEKYNIDVNASDYLITIFEQIKQSRNLQ
jgi:hypothetical protein